MDPRDLLVSHFLSSLVLSCSPHSQQADSSSRVVNQITVNGRGDNKMMSLSIGGLSATRWTFSTWSAGVQTAQRRLFFAPDAAVEAILKVCANIYISRPCLSNEEGESGLALPSSCQWGKARGLAAPTASSPTCSITRRAWPRRTHPMRWARTPERGGVSRPWRYALLKIGPTWQPVSTSFQQVFACVDTAHALAPARRQSWSWGLLVYTIFDGRGRLRVWGGGGLTFPCVCVCVCVWPRLF